MQKIKVVLFDLSRTLLFPADTSYDGDLNPLHEIKSQEQKDTYSFFDYFRLNESLIEMVEVLKKRSTLRFAIFTSGSIQKYPELKEELSKYFDPIFSGIELKVSKRESTTYSIIASKLEVGTSEALFVDDLSINIQAAIESGMSGIQYVGAETLEEIQRRIDE